MADARSTFDAIRSTGAPPRRAARNAPGRTPPRRIRTAARRTSRRAPRTPWRQRRGITLSSGARRSVMTRSASARSSVIHAHIVTSACGKPPAGLPAAASCFPQQPRAAAEPARVICTPTPATRRPAGPPGAARRPTPLPIHSGTVPAGRGTGSNRASGTANACRRRVARPRPARPSAWSRLHRNAATWTQSRHRTQHSRFSTSRPHPGDHPATRQDIQRGHRLGQRHRPAERRQTPWSPASSAPTAPPPQPEQWPSHGAPNRK